jgi:hypothetical protein
MNLEKQHCFWQQAVVLLDIFSTFWIVELILICRTTEALYLYTLRVHVHLLMMDLNVFNAYWKKTGLLSVVQMGMDGLL